MMTLWFHFGSEPVQLQQQQHQQQQHQMLRMTMSSSPPPPPLPQGDADDDEDALAGDAASRATRRVLPVDGDLPGWVPKDYMEKVGRRSLHFY